MMRGTRLTGDLRAQRLAEARQWREDNRAFFDAIYGPDTPPGGRGRCPTCGARKRVVTRKDCQ